MTAAYLSMLAHTIALLFIPVIVRWIVDHGIISGDRRILIRSAIVLAAVSAARGLFGFFQGRLAETAAQRLAYDIRNEIFQKLGVIQLAFIEKMETGQILQRAIQDIERVRFVVSKALLRVMDATLLFIGTLIFMLAMNPILGSVSLIPIPFLAFQTLLFAKQQKPLAAKLQHRLGTMTSVLEQNLQGTRLVKGFAQEPNQISRFQTEINRWFTVSARNTRLRAIHLPLLTLIANLGLVVVIGIGGLMVVHGESIGLLVAFTTYLTQLFLPVRRVGAMLPLSVQGIASAERVSEILDAPIAIKEDPAAKALPLAQGEIRFHEIDFSYGGTNHQLALNNINLTVAAGSQIAIIGPTGSGKTTLISLLLRLYDPDRGSVEIDGTNLQKVTLSSLRSQIGIVLQETVLFAATIGENIAFGRPDASIEEINTAAETAQIHSFIENLPQGYETPVGERGLTLSGGQKQRIAIARALLVNPRILIMDDATSSVDARTEGLILSALRKNSNIRTTFVIAHRPSICKEADAVLLIDEGKISAYGTHQDLLEQSLLYCDIFEHSSHPPNLHAGDHTP